MQVPTQHMVAQPIRVNQISVAAHHGNVRKCMFRLHQGAADVCSLCQSGKASRCQVASQSAVSTRRVLSTSGKAAITPVLLIPPAAATSSAAPELSSQRHTWDCPKPNPTRPDRHLSAASQPRIPSLALHQLNRPERRPTVYPECTRCLTPSQLRYFEGALCCEEAHAPTLPFAFCDTR